MTLFWKCSRSTNTKTYHILVYVGKVFFLSSVQIRSLPLVINFFVALSFFYIENFPSTDLEMRLARSQFRFFLLSIFFLFLTKLHLHSSHLPKYCSPFFSESFIHSKFSFNLLNVWFLNFFCLKKSISGVWLTKRNLTLKLENYGYLDLKANCLLMAWHVGANLWVHREYFSDYFALISSHIEL